MYIFSNNKFTWPLIRPLLCDNMLLMPRMVCTLVGHCNNYVDTRSTVVNANILPQADSTSIKSKLG